MFITMGQVSGTLSGANITSLVPKGFEEGTLESFVGYELVQGHVNAMSIQPYVEIFGIPSLEKTQEHVWQSTQLWNNTTALAVNRVYNRMISYPFSSGEDKIFERLKWAASQLADKEKRDECIIILEYYLGKTKEIGGEIASLIVPLNEFRASLEEDTRNFGGVLSEMNELTSLAGKTMEGLKAELSRLDQEVEALNQSIIQKKVGEADPERAQSIKGIPIFSWLVTAGTRLITKPWGPDEALLRDKEVERDRRIYQLANVERRIAYLSVLSGEYFKLYASFSMVISAVQRMREAWGTLSLHLGNVINELHSLQQVDIENEAYLLRIYLNLFESSVKQLNRNITAFKQARQVKVTIDDLVKKLLLPRSVQTFYSSTPAFPNILLNAYANRAHQHRFFQDESGVWV